MSASNSGNFHVAADTVDWYTVTAYDGAPTLTFAVLDVSLSGGSSDGQYAIEVSEGSAASPMVLGLTTASHAPRVAVSWAAAGVPSKLLRIKVSHVAGQPSNDLYSLRMVMSESATTPLTMLPLSPQIPGAAVPSGSTSTQGTQTTQTTQSSSGPATAVGCDADSPLLACVLPPMNVGMSTINSGNFHVAADTDWYVVTAYDPSPTAPYAVLEISLGGGSPDGQFAIEVSEGSLSSPVILGTSPASHTPRVTASWAAANAPSKVVWIKVSHVAGLPSNDLYSLRLQMSESATLPLTVVPVAPQIINAIPVGGR